MATGWGDIGLVLAGTTGPLLITLANARVAARQEDRRWRREDLELSRRRHAQFIASAAQVMADWYDYATIPPQSIDEERSLDARRDDNYAKLNELSALLRLSASPAIVAEAEAMLAEVRAAQHAAKATPAKETPGVAPADWGEIDGRFAAARSRFVAICRGTDAGP